jgi:hypothetical protein
MSNQRNPMNIIRKPAIVWAALGLAGATALPAETLLFTIDNQSDSPWHLGHQSGPGMLNVAAWADSGKWTSRPEALKPGPSLGVIAPRASVVFRVDLPEGRPALDLYLLRHEDPGSLLALPVPSLAATESLGTFTLTPDGKLVPPAPPRTPTTPGPAAPAGASITPERKLLPRSPSDPSPLEHSDGLEFKGGSPLYPPVPGLHPKFQPALEGQPFMVVTNLSNATWYVQPADENGKMYLMQPDGGRRELKRWVRTERMPDGHLNEVEQARWVGFKIPPGWMSIIILEPSDKDKGVFWLHTDSGNIRAFAAVQPQGAIILPRAGSGLDRRSIDAVFERHFVDPHVFTIQKDTWPEAKATAPMLPTSTTLAAPAPVPSKVTIPPETPLPSPPLPMPGAAPAGTGQSLSWGDVANLVKGLRSRAEDPGA